MAKNTRIEITGGVELKRKLKALGPIALETCAASLYQSLNNVMTRSKDVFVPVDTGALRSSGRVDPPIIEGHSVQTSIGYGGASAPYALYVHEINKAYHGGRQWKYLQTPLAEAISDINQKLVDDLNRAFKNL